MKHKALFGVTLALAAVAVPCQAAPGVTPVGAPFRIDSGTESGVLYAYPLAVMRANGGFVAAWSSYHDGVRVRSYGAGGVPLTADFQANNVPVGGTAVQVSVNAAGDFAVAWIADPAPSSSPLPTLHARLFHADGSPLGDEFRVDDDSHGLQSFGSPNSKDTPFSIALNNSNQLLAGWVVQDSGRNLLSPTSFHSGLYVRRFNATGAPLDTSAHEVSQNADLLTEVTDPTVAVADDGHFLAAWAASGGEKCWLGYGQGGCVIKTSPYEYRFRLLDATGAPQGSQRSVPSTLKQTNGLYPTLQAAMGPAGDFALAWWNYPTSKQDQWQISSQAYTAAGQSRRGAGADVPRGLGNSEYAPGLGVDMQGDYVVAYLDQARVYVPTAAGAMQPLSAEFTSPVAYVSAATMSANNQFLLVGELYDNTDGVFGQLYSFSK